MKQIELETKLQQLETDLIDRKTSIENEIRATRTELAIAESEYYRKRGELKSRINAFEIQIANMKADYFAR